MKRVKGFKFIITTEIKESADEIQKAIQEQGIEAILEQAKEIMEETINVEFGDLTNAKAVVEAIY